MMVSFFWTGYYTEIRIVDFICLILSVLTIFIWIMTRNLVFSAVLLVFIDVVSCIPTLRKTWINPQTEDKIAWIISFLSIIFAFLAIENYSVLTALSPGWNIIFNFSMAMLTFRNSSHIK